MRYVNNPRVTYVPHYWWCDGETRFLVTVDGHNTREEQGSHRDGDKFIDWLSSRSDSTLDAIVQDLIREEANFFSVRTR